MFVGLVPKLDTARRLAAWAEPATASTLTAAWKSFILTEIMLLIPRLEEHSITTSVP
jgi:hypothetical protein